MTTASTLDRLSCRDKLLFSQAIYEFGADSWSKISEVLLSHPLIQLPREMLAPESVADIYRALAAEMPDTTDGRGNADATKKPYARFHLRIAQKHYTARVQELRTSIKANEEEFERIAKEIEELRAGEWDVKLAARLREKKAALAKLENLVIQDKTAEIKERPKAVDEKTTTAEVTVPDDVPSQDMDEDIVESHTTLQVEPESTAQGKTSASPSTAEEEEPRIEELHISDSKSEQAAPPAPNVEDNDGSVSAATPSNEHEQQAESPADEAPSAGRRQPREKAKGGRTTRRTRNKSPSPTSPDDDAMEVTSELPSSSAAKSDEPDQTQADDKAADAIEDDSMQVDESTAATEIEVETPQKIRPDTRMETTDSPPTAAATPADASADKTPLTGPRASRRGKRKTMDVDDKTVPPRSVKRLRETSENVDTGDEDEVSTPQRKDFKRFIGMLHNEIASHKSGNIFQKPVNSHQAPNYYDIIKRPMDLKTIRTRYMRTGEITNSNEYRRDLNLMFCNALMFNRPGSDVYTIAQSMMMDCEQQVQDFFQTHR